MASLYPLMRENPVPQDWDESRLHLNFLFLYPSSQDSITKSRCNLKRAAGSSVLKACGVTPIGGR